MDENYFKQIMTVIILSVLIIVLFFLLKPILLSIVLGVILAFIFLPVYNWINGIIKSGNITASIMCISLILLIFLPAWFLTPIILNQSVKVYIASQQMDFITPLKTFFPD